MRTIFIKIATGIAVFGLGAGVLALHLGISAEAAIVIAAIPMCVAGLIHPDV